MSWLAEDPGFECEPPSISEDAVRALESRLGFALPMEYRSFLLETNGGRPSRAVIDIPGLEGGEALVDPFFGVVASYDSDTIEWNSRLLSARLEPRFLPIAGDSLGNVYCLSASGPDAGAILYCDLQSVFARYDLKPKLYPVAKNFAEFFRSLRAKSRF